MDLLSNIANMLNASLEIIFLYLLSFIDLTSISRDRDLYFQRVFFLSKNRKQSTVIIFHVTLF